MRRRGRRRGSFDKNIGTAWVDNSDNDVGLLTV